MVNPLIVFSPLGIGCHSICLYYMIKAFLGFLYSFHGISKVKHLRKQIGNQCNGDVSTHDS